MLVAYFGISFLNSVAQFLRPRRGILNSNATTDSEGKSIGSRKSSNDKLILRKPRISVTDKMSNQQQQQKEKNVCSEKPTIITFQTDDKQGCYETFGKDVQVIGSSGNHDHGSSKVKLKNIVDYKWEKKNYPGHLIAVHIDGRHIAYVINVNNKASRMEGMVRVLNSSTGMRALIKGMFGEVLDLQFAHIEHERILACIDVNSLYVHKIDMLNDALLCNLMIKIEDPLADYTPKYDKIAWCPFISVEGEDDEDNQLIVWARGSLFQCFNINTILSEYGTGKKEVKNITEGYLKYRDNTMTITWVTLSPDGSTMAVCSLDGVIRFYQVYMHDDEPRCLHQWKPYDGNPVSSVFFLDDITRTSTDNYWKYAVTGGLNNSEIKVWDCGTWECLQTIKLSTADASTGTLYFIAEIDRTASYLVLSNLETRACYILQIMNAGANSRDTTNDNESSSSKSSTCGSSTQLMKTSNAKTSLVFIKSVSEFPLSSGILSFSIVDAAVRRYKCGNDNYVCDEFDDYEEDTSSLYCVVVRMFIVQTKSMQECHILYQPSVTEKAHLNSTLSVLDGQVKKNYSPNNGEKEQSDDDKPEKPVIKSEKVEVDTNTSADPVLGIGNSDSSTSINTESTNCHHNNAIVSPSLMNMSKGESPNLSPLLAASANAKVFGQVNLMTPDAFSTTTNDKKTPEVVSSEVRNTLMLLAGVTGQTSSNNKSENANILNLVNSKIIEDQEHQKQQFKQILESQKKFVAIDNNPGQFTGDNLTSGGSSPSREVREILSSQDFDKSSYSGDEMLDEPSVKTVVDCTSAGTTSKSQPVMANWPKAPEVTKGTTKHSAELQNAANLIAQAVHASSASNLNNNHLPPTLISSHHTSSSNLANVHSAELNELNTKMSQLIDLVKVQSLHISTLENEMAEMKSVVLNRSFVAEETAAVESTTDLPFERYEKALDERFNRMRGWMEKQFQEADDRYKIYNQHARVQISNIVNKSMAAEVQTQLLPLLVERTGVLQQQVQKDISLKLSTLDKILKENITQVCKNKNIIDTFGKSVLIGVQESLQTAFIATMSTTLVPAYEKSSQHMFKELHVAFSMGLKELMDHFENYIQHMQPMHNSSIEAINNFNNFRQHLDEFFVSQRSTMVDVLHEVRKDIKSLEILLTRQMQELFRTELRKIIDSQTPAVRSQANTPNPHYDLRDTIRHLLQQGHINKAFHQALLANDLSLVEFTLRNADHNTVFNPTCCLEQKVVLSLIQQISADMSNHNEVKQNFLAEALLAINPKNPLIREHAPKVLQELFRNCQWFLTHCTSNAQCSNVRMLLACVQGLKDQFIN